MLRSSEGPPPSFQEMKAQRAACLWYKVYLALQQRDSQREMIHIDVSFFLQQLDSAGGFLAATWPVKYFSLLYSLIHFKVTVSLHPLFPLSKLAFKLKKQSCLTWFLCSPSCFFFFFFLFNLSGVFRPLGGRVSRD